MLLAAACGADPAPDVTQDRPAADSGAETTWESPAVGSNTSPDEDARHTQQDAGWDTDTPTSDAGTQRDSASEGRAAPSGIPCDVLEVLETHCLRCHGAAPQFGATTALARHADFHAPSQGEPGRLLHEVAADRLLASDAGRRMPPANQPQLSAAALNTLGTWLSDAAPASSETCAAPAPPDPDPSDETDVSDLTCYKLLAHAPGDMDAKYHLGAVRDTYINFSFAAPWGNKTGYAVIARPIIDNAKALHHWLLFQEHGDDISDGAVSSSSGLHPTGEMINGWAPGGGHVDFRASGEDVGYEFLPGTFFDLEVHYNSSDPDALDASGVELCLQDRRPAHIAAISWLGSDLIWDATSVESTCVPQASEPIHIVRISPHMHLQGRHLTSIIHRRDGSREVLHDAPFDFQEQAFYATDVVIQPGDRITTRCDYHRAVSFGNATTDEMCYLFALAYPKGALSDGGLVGTLVHGGGACLGY